MTSRASIPAVAPKYFVGPAQYLGGALQYLAGPAQYLGGALGERRLSVFLMGERRK